MLNLFFYLKSNWMSEMTQGLADEEDTETTPDQPVVKPTKPKTRRQKIKAKILKLREFRRLKLKNAKKRMNALNRYGFHHYSYLFPQLKKK